MIETLRETATPASSSSQHIVASLASVNKTYGEVQALCAVDFRARAGEVVALLGPNGAGKTTAVKLLLGLLQPNRGKVLVFGGDPLNPENRMRTGAMLQVAKVPETIRVREHIDLFSSLLPKAHVFAGSSGRSRARETQRPEVRRLVRRLKTNECFLRWTKFQCSVQSSNQRNRCETRNPKRETWFPMTSKKSLISTLLLILLGVAALLSSASMLVVLVPAALLVWYGAAPMFGSNRN